MGSPLHVWHHCTVSDYDRIAAVIRHLDAHRHEQPDLGELAAAAGLSPSHLHRTFCAWAGVTPKDFLQFLTLAHARELLRNGSNVLDAALASGLSGPGRLHDLCVGLEAASPGEIAAGGHGWSIAYGFAPCPFGLALIAETPRGLSRIALVDAPDDPAARSLVGADWPRASLVRDDARAALWTSRIFRTPPGDARPSLRAFVRGTPFQLRVWRALLELPPGTLATYGRLAAFIGHPTATRALGTAVGQNPIAFLIPCHRVIRGTGVIGNYRWGPLRKRAILAWEEARHADAPQPHDPQRPFRPNPIPIRSPP